MEYLPESAIRVHAYFGRIPFLPLRQIVGLQLAQDSKEAGLE
jgi:hypothetical protein